MTNSWQDQKIAALVAEHGLEGYGFYWRLVEIIASNSDKNSSYSCDLTPKVWARLAGLTVVKCSRLVDAVAILRLISVKKFQKTVEISIPNIGKYRDEYSRKRGNATTKTPDKLRTSSGQYPAHTETDTELDTDTETEADSDAGKKTPPPLSRPPKFHAKLLKALDKIIVSPEEILICEKLIAASCTFEDIEEARKEKGKNQLKYLQNIVCEMRDRRLKQEENNDNPFIPGRR